MAEWAETKSRLFWRFIGKLTAMILGIVGLVLVGALALVGISLA